MAQDPTEHQIVIVGGGITGLTLALMCQHYKINYVLLEAYGSVTPNVGASIGLAPNGLRVLDQLGLYEKILAVGAPVEHMISRLGSNGKFLMDRQIKHILTERHGYPNVFMERHQLLKVMEAAIVDKDRLLVNKKVTRVDNLEDVARVYTADGSEYRGQLVVGADGIKSTIRKEMWRTADEQDGPGTIPAQDRDDVPCEYACIFGTARPNFSTKGCTAGDVSLIQGQDVAVGTMGGPFGEVFIFWFWKLTGTGTGTGGKNTTTTTCAATTSLDQLPTFSEEDKLREMARGRDFFINGEGDRFGTILDALEYSVATPLPHYCMRRWQHRRIVILGDAAHKFNPLVGQGGNSCIESCASLVNHLRECLGPEEMGCLPSSWPLAKLSKALVGVQEERVKRVTGLVDASQDIMKMYAWDSVVGRLMAKYWVPNISDSQYVDTTSDMVHEAVSLKGEFKVAPHSWPFADEEKLKRKTSGVTTTATVSAIVPIVALATILLARTGRGHTEGVLSSVFSWFRRV